jgi:hypothetical protein
LALKHIFRSYISQREDLIKIEINYVLRLISSSLSYLLDSKPTLSSSCFWWSLPFAPPKISLLPSIAPPKISLLPSTLFLLRMKKVEYFHKGVFGFEKDPNLRTMIQIFNKLCSLKEQKMLFPIHPKVSFMSLKYLKSLNLASLQELNMTVNTE